MVSGPTSRAVGCSTEEEEYEDDEKRSFTHFHTWLWQAVLTTLGYFMIFTSVAFETTTVYHRVIMHLLRAHVHVHVYTCIHVHVICSLLRSMCVLYFTTISHNSATSYIVHVPQVDKKPTPTTCTCIYNIMYIQCRCVYYTVYKWSSLWRVCPWGLAQFSWCDGRAELWGE